MHFEHFSQPVLAYGLWLRRILRSSWMALIIVLLMLLLGVVGYHVFGGLTWIDAFLEASMILGGMGAVAPMTNDAVKLFASCYALLSGLVVLTTTGLILAPFVHRLLHHLYAHSTKPEKKSDAGDRSAND